MEVRGVPVWCFLTSCSFMVSFYRWSSSVQNYFRSQVFPVQSDHGLDLNTLRDAGVFVPVLPVFEKVKHASKKEKKDKKEKKEKKSKKNLIGTAD